MVSGDLSGKCYIVEILVQLLLLVYWVDAFLECDMMAQMLNFKVHWNYFEVLTWIEIMYPFLSHNVVSGRYITLCNKIDKPLVVYRFSGSIMTSIITLHKRWENPDVFTPKMWVLINFNVMWWIESSIHALVLLNLLNWLRKSNKILGKPHILSLFPNLFNKFNKTWALM